MTVLFPQYDSTILADIRNITNVPPADVTGGLLLPLPTVSSSSIVPTSPSPSTTTTTTELPCSAAPLSIDNGIVPTCLNASGSTCHPTCNTGYVLASSYTCRFGDWFGTPTCVAPCYSSPADPSNGHMNCSGTAHEESCIPTCARGYTAFGSYTCNFSMWYLGTSSVACYESPGTSSSCMFCQGTDKFYAVVIGGSLGFIFLLCLLFVLLRRKHLHIRAHNQHMV